MAYRFPHLRMLTKVQFISILPLQTLVMNAEKGEMSMNERVHQKEILVLIDVLHTKFQLERNEAFQTESPEDPALWGAAQT